MSHGCFYWKPRSCQVFYRWVWELKVTHYTNCLVCYPGDQARGNTALESCLLHFTCGKEAKREKAEYCRNKRYQHAKILVHRFSFLCLFWFLLASKLPERVLCVGFFKRMSSPYHIWEFSWSVEFCISTFIARSGIQQLINAVTKGALKLPHSQSSQ